MCAHLITALRARVNPGELAENSGCAPRDWKTLPVKSVQRKATVPELTPGNPGELWMRSA